ncbi:MAG: SDR family NAD(P)-dependent oxidoreductase, partial [Gammaproteobacteria bacterium]
MDVQASPRKISDRPLADRVAIITGSTSGIGLGIARSLSAAGAHIVLNGLGDEDVIEATRLELENSATGMVVYNDANLMNATGASALVADTIAEFGKVDILVNNAGIQHVSPIEDF